MSQFVGYRRISRVKLERMAEKTEQVRRVLDFSRPKQGGGSTDLSKLDYWYSITGANTLRVNGGKVPILGQNITVAAADVDCPGDDTGALYAYMEVNVAAKTGTIVATAVSGEPVTELGTMRKVLYELHKASGSIVIDAIRITDPWVLPLFVE